MRVICYMCIWHCMHIWYCMHVSLVVYQPKPIERRWLEAIMWCRNSLQFYLVELSRALLLFIQLFGDNNVIVGQKGGYKTLKYKVFELDVIKGELKEEIKNLGESAIFVGRNRASSVDTSMFTVVKPNHIYFADNWYEYFNADIVTYNLEDGKIEAFCLGVSLSPPTWITPSF